MVTAEARTFYLQPETQSWPVGDEQHALIALQYMTRGFGKRSEYPRLLARLRQRWPLDRHPRIAAAYARLLPKIKEKHMLLRRNPLFRSNRSDSLSLVDQLLATAPSDWRTQFNNGIEKLRKNGSRVDSQLNLSNALLILGTTAGGNRSNDVARGEHAVPPAVRDAALKGLQLSHRNNYGAWNFIGVARALQLATQPGVPSDTISRMRAYFSRHQKDQSARNFGNDSNPSRGYMAWLNWGGDAGEAWVNNIDVPRRSR